MTDYQGIDPPARLYAERDIEDQGEHYVRHVNAMTAEDLHSKSDIAAELAHRDIEIERLRSLIERAHTIISIREVSFRTHKGAAWLQQASRELNERKSSPETIGFTELPPRPKKPEKWLDVGERDERARAEHFSMMTDYWIAEAQWQEKRGDQLNAELTALLRSQHRVSSGINSDAIDAAKWRALRTCARITAMGSAGLGDDKAAEDYGHVTLNFWTGVDDVDRGPEYARDWLDRFVEKARRSKGSRPAAAGLATGSTDQPAPETIVSPEPAREPPLEQRCRRGHVWHVTFTEWRDYKGDLPMPCPVCIREGLRP